LPPEGAYLSFRQVACVAVLATWLQLFSQLKTQRKACTDVDTFLPHQVRVAACSCQRFPSAFLWSTRSDDGLVNDQILTFHKMSCSVAKPRTSCVKRQMPCLNARLVDIPNPKPPRQRNLRFPLPSDLPGPSVLLACARLGSLKPASSSH
jgi:hypothetical protein